MTGEVMAISRNAPMHAPMHGAGTTGSPQLSTNGLFDQNRIIWRRNYLAYGIAFLLLGISALLVMLGLDLQSRLLTVAEATAEELAVMRRISDRLEYIFDQNASEPITIELVMKATSENRISADKLKELNKIIMREKESISKHWFMYNILVNKETIWIILSEYEKHFREYINYLEVLGRFAENGPIKYLNTHSHFVSLKLPFLLAAQNSLNEKVQAAVREQQTTMKLGFAILCGGMFSGLALIWGLIFVPLHRQNTANSNAIHSQYRQLDYLAHWDVLTSLGNRHLFHEVISEFDFDLHPVCLALIDVDRFKSINDNFGHVHGDRVLKVLGERMKERMSGKGRLFRLGGDEFAIIFDGRIRHETIRHSLDRLVRDLRNPIRLPECTLSVSASIGLAISGRSASDDGEALYAAADKALYQAKLNGGDQLACYSDLFQRSISCYISGDQDLLEAVRANRLKVAYQPIVCLQTGRTIKLEALARMVSPEGGMLGPAAWIADAERLGLMSRISWKILDLIKSEVTDLQRVFPDLESIALNVTGVMLADDRLEQEIRSTSTTSGRPWLSIELTEGCMIERGSGHIGKHLKTLSDAGGSISLDDFGTGFASLAHLQQIPFDTIKIDRRFLVDIEGDTANRVIIEGMVKLAHGLGKQVVCEGIESEPVLSVLRRLGCEYGQGYYFARPQPVEYWRERFAAVSGYFLRETDKTVLQQQEV